ncbi:MAG: hypothetical protein RIC14_09845 [Filomicrobium sp.]
MRWIYIFSCLVAVWLLSAAPALSEPKPNKAPNASAKTNEPLPNEIRLNLLIRTTIIAVNNANLTNNYSVLRELASGQFKKANSAKRLSEIFAPLRKRKIDFAPILFFPPKLIKPAAIDADGRLRLSGFFDTRPERIIFDMLFLKEEPGWKLFGILLDTKPAQAAKAKQNTQAPRQAPNQ